MILSLVSLATAGAHPTSTCPAQRCSCEVWYTGPAGYLSRSQIREKESGHVRNSIPATSFQQVESSKTPAESRRRACNTIGVSHVILLTCLAPVYDSLTTRRKHLPRVFFLIQEDAYPNLRALTNESEVLLNKFNGKRRVPLSPGPGAAVMFLRVLGGQIHSHLWFSHWS